jgi:Fic family protein
VPNQLTRWIWELPDWPDFTWDYAVLATPLAEARRVQGEALGMTRFMDASMNQAAQLETLSVEGVATSAIEGEHFDPNSLRSSFARRLGMPPQNSMPAATGSVEGLSDVLLDATRRYNEALTLAQLAGWQAALFPTGRSGLHEIPVGKLRGSSPMRIVSGPIERERVHYVAPPRDRLDAEMHRFLSWFNTPRAELDGLIRAGLVHAWFEVIHPFEDGNGRIGRALIDRALAQDERQAIRLYSVSAQLMKVRDQYYAALESLSRGPMDVTPWLGWFLTQFTAAVRQSAQTIGHVLRKARFWMQHAQTPINDRQRNALNSMLDAGPTGFAGGMTNRKYANLTNTSTATAQRDLASLVGLGCLQLTGAGRSARYELPSPLADGKL